MQLTGLDWDVPDFSTLSRRQRTLAVNIPFRGSNGPRHLLIDSTGIKVEITGNNTGDAPMLPHLLNQIPRDQEIGSVTADGAYDTRRCHNAIARNDALRASKYLGRALWRNWSGYHRRSRVETTLPGSCYA